MNLTSDKQLLQDYNDIKIKEYAPVIAFVSVSAVLGIFGNAMAFIFFRFKTKRNVSTFLISFLALNDMVTSLILGVNNVIFLMNTITFASVVGCKIIWFMSHIPTTNSMSLLLLICVDRYLLVCWPTSKWVLRKRTAIKVIVGLLVYAVLHAVRLLFLTDTVEIKVSVNANTTILGHHCWRTRDESKMAAVETFDFLEISGLIAIVLSFIVLYSLILRTIANSRANMNTHTIKKHESNDIVLTNCIVSSDIEITSDSQLTMETEFLNGNTEDPNCKRDDNVCATIVTDVPRSSRRDSVCAAIETEQTGNSSKYTACDIIESAHVRNTNIDTTPGTIETEQPIKTFQHKPTLERKGDSAERNVTLMMLAVTAMSIIAFVPYYVYAIAVEPSISNVNELGSGLNVLPFSVILNSTVNPYVMCLVNRKFRLFMKSVFTCGHGL